MRDLAPVRFDIAVRPVTLEDQWRAIILFGRNVASYKFALARALLDLRPQSGTLVHLEDLALPFAKHVCKHLLHEDKQATSTSSAFLEGCRQFNRGELAEDDLRALTIVRGFANVIDAFHVVGRADTPRRFFVDDRASHKALRITDEFGMLMSNAEVDSLPKEVEARWRLVETAWRLRLSSAMVVTHDAEENVLLLPDAAHRRRAVTTSRNALNGYQRGVCFYCGTGISLTRGDFLAEVDHFFPHTLKKRGGLGAAVDGVWNLVLACRSCNRGTQGKLDQLPSLRLLERLHARNEFLITSHHPLRETLMLQTGASEAGRRDYLNRMFERARSALIHHGWEPYG